MARENAKLRGLLLRQAICWLLTVSGAAFGQEPKWEVGDSWKRGWVERSSAPRAEARRSLPVVFDRYMMEAWIVTSPNSTSSGVNQRTKAIPKLQTRSLER